MELDLGDFFGGRALVADPDLLTEPIISIQLSTIAPFPKFIIEPVFAMNLGQTTTHYRHTLAFYPAMWCQGALVE